VVYVFSGLAKLNPSYLSGEMLSSELRPYVLTALAANYGILITLGVAAVALELAVAAGLWFRHSRPSAMLLGLLFHAVTILTISYSLPIVPFAALMMSVYVLFLDPEPSSRTVLWDARSATCRRWVGRFARLDWFDVHHFVGEPDPALLASYGVAADQADEAMLVLGPGEHVAGFDVVRAILAVCPLTFLLAPLLRIWPIPLLGRAVYRHVALHRTCAIPTA
jgi:predicted DCC family thiol-disulfide oxidoreductase YuxK